MIGPVVDLSAVLNAEHLVTECARQVIQGKVLGLDVPAHVAFAAQRPVGAILARPAVAGDLGVTGFQVGDREVWIMVCCCCC